MTSSHGTDTSAQAPESDGIHRVSVLLYSDDVTTRDAVRAAAGRRPARDVEIVRWHECATAEAVVELLTPIQARVAELQADPGEVRRRLALGTERATAQATDVMDRVWDRLGTLRA